MVFNCSEQLTSAMLVRYLFGMIRSGSWACFENIDCVGPGILSIFGEHLSNIKISLKCLEKFVLSQYSARGFAKTDSQKVCFDHPGLKTYFILPLSRVDKSKVLSDRVAIGRVGGGFYQGGGGLSMSK